MMPSSVLLALSNTETTWLFNWPLFLSGLCFQLARWLTFPKVSVGPQCGHACFHFAGDNHLKCDFKGNGRLQIAGDLDAVVLPARLVFPWSVPLGWWRVQGSRHGMNLWCHPAPLLEDKRCPRWAVGMRAQRLAGASVYLISLLCI